MPSNCSDSTDTGSSPFARGAVRTGPATGWPGSSSRTSSIRPSSWPNAALRPSGLSSADVQPPPSRAWSSAGSAVTSQIPATFAPLSASRVRPPAVASDTPVMAPPSGSIVTVVPGEAVSSAPRHRVILPTPARTTSSPSGDTAIRERPSPAHRVGA